MQGWVSVAVLMGLNKVYSNIFEKHPTSDHAYNVWHMIAYLYAYKQTGKYNPPVSNSPGVIAHRIEEVVSYNCSWLKAFDASPNLRSN